MDLKDITSAVLGKNLLQKKTITNSKKESLKSHWRDGKLTNQMVKYVAEDIAAALDMFDEKMKSYENKFPDGIKAIELQVELNSV